jgi:hypothetical protein
LPRSKQAISLWKDKDEAFLEVAKEIRAAVLGQSGNSSKKDMRYTIVSAAEPSTIAAGRSGLITRFLNWLGRQPMRPTRGSPPSEVAKVEQLELAESHEHNK